MSEAQVWFLPEGESQLRNIGTADVTLKASYHDNRFVWPRLKPKRIRLRFLIVEGPGIRHLRHVVSKLRRLAQLRMQTRLKRHGQNWRHIKLPKVTPR